MLRGIWETSDRAERLFNPENGGSYLRNKQGLSRIIICMLKPQWLICDTWCLIGFLDALKVSLIQKHKLSASLFTLPTIYLNIFSFIFFNPQFINQNQLNQNEDWVKIRIPWTHQLKFQRVSFIIIFNPQFFTSSSLPSKPIRFRKDQNSMNPTIKISIG